MKLNKVFKFLFISLALFLSTSIFAEAAAKEKEEDTAAALENALKNYEKKKQQEQEELVVKLNKALQAAINEWINAAKRDKESKMDSLVEQNWEKNALALKIPPAHNDYYLRGYKYTVTNSEISKTLSLSNIYKAVVSVREDLYVEKYHSPAVSDINQYFYTVGTNYILNFDYKTDKFELTSTNSQILDFANDAPADIKKQRIQ